MGGEGFGEASHKGPLRHFILCQLKTICCVLNVNCHTVCLECGIWMGGGKAIKNIYD